VRIGDLYRLTGDFKSAIAQYQQAAPKIDPRAAPAQDRAYSITISDFLDDSHRDDAYAKLAEWELRHPMAKFGSDFLILRARVLIAYGRWGEALSELESFQKIQPDSSFAIDADFYRARALFELGRKDEARKIWNAIARNYPKHDLALPSKDWAAKP
jgi:tetratricopeptide (TPR) repeat protein